MLVSRVWPNDSVIPIHMLVLSQSFNKGYCRVLNIDPFSMVGLVDYLLYIVVCIC